MNEKDKRITHESLAEMGVVIPELSLPASNNVALEKWAVIACDQYTQSHEYWRKVDDFVGDSPSTLRMIYPEIYLDEENRAERIKKIHDTMRDYIKDEFSKTPILLPARHAGLFVERETKHGLRRGLVLAVDLERYDWKKDAQSLLRATEATIEERLPPRIELRSGAPLETPHIMLLIDDEENVLMNLLCGIVKNAPYVYKTPLMCGGGAISGKLLYRKNDWDFIADSLYFLLRRSETRFKTGFLFAVGDGNHSLAAAKETWERFKAISGASINPNHPARYALVEVVNLYDTSLIFEPIHRVLFNVNFDAVLDALKKLTDFSCKEIDSKEKLKALVEDDSGKRAKNRYGIITKEKNYLVEARGGKAATIDLEPLLVKIDGARLDYIHGGDELFSVVDTKDCVGVLLPPFSKDNFFRSIAENGPLPRKSFSMGTADEKRFYFECRKLF